MSDDDIRVRCVAITKSGKQCKNYAVSSSTFCAIHGAATAVSPQTAESNPRLQELISELDGLVAQLKGSMPATDSSPYSPLRLVTLLRENLHRFTPEVRLGILESFEGMTKEDLMDIDTWKGMAFMLSYSARFQANQVKDQLNERLPTPLKPDTLVDLAKRGMDKLTPTIFKDIMGNLQGATKEDLLDPDTWKGIWYMVNYSLQFQVDQLKQRISGEGEGETS